MGGGQICLCVAYFLGEKKETHKQTSQEISGKCRDSPGQYQEIYVSVFSCLLFFFSELQTHPNLHSPV